MHEIEIIKEKPLSLAEMKEQLDKVGKNEELGFRSTRTLEYLKAFGKEKKVQEKKKKLEDLDIQRLKTKHIAKFIDMSPQDEDSVKAVLAMDNITLKQEDIKRITDTLKQ